MASVDRRWWGVALGLGLAACRGGGATPPPAPKVEEAPAPPPKVAEQPPTPSIQESSFKLALEADPSYTGGSDGKFRLSLDALGGYHINQDYPVRVDVRAPGPVKLPKASLGKADAAQFGEQAARFEIPFNAPKGSHSVSVSVDFAVCTKETCVPDQRTLALTLPVM